MFSIWCLYVLVTSSNKVGNCNYLIPNSHNAPTPPLVTSPNLAGISTVPLSGLLQKHGGTSGKGDLLSIQVRQTYSYIQLYNCNAAYHSLCSFLSPCCLGLCRPSCSLRDGQDQPTHAAPSPDSSPHSPDWSCAWWSAAGCDHDRPADRPFGQNARCHDQTARSDHCALDSSCFWRGNGSRVRERQLDAYMKAARHVCIAHLWGTRLSDSREEDEGCWRAENLFRVLVVWRLPASEPDAENTVSVVRCSSAYRLIHTNLRGLTRICRFSTGATATALAPASPCAFTSWGKQLIVEVKNRSLKDKNTLQL